MAGDDAELRNTLRRVLLMREEMEQELVDLRARQEMLLDLLRQAGVMSKAHASLVDQAGERARAKPRKRVYLAVVGDKYAVAGADIDCASLIHLCHGRCCAFRFALSEQDLAEGAARWTLDDPYLNHQDGDGYCTHSVRANGGCGIYDQRPYHCREYDCRKDPRVWIDFDARLPAGMPDGIQIIARQPK